MTNLLERTRRINKLLEKSAGRAVDFDELSKGLSESIETNVYIVGRDGELLGYGLLDGFECAIMQSEVLRAGRFPPDYNEWLMRVVETRPNIGQRDRECAFKAGVNCVLGDKLTTVVPISGGGERLGTLLLARVGRPFNDDDLVLAEYGATVVGLEMLQAKAQRVEEEARKRAAVQVALGTLSYSELEAVSHIFEELEGREGFLVASKIADRVGITRSVIVNALRKFESAGVIESRSLGMKGTYIRVLNDRLLEELKRVAR